MLLLSHIASEPTFLNNESSNLKKKKKKKQLDGGQKWNVLTNISCSLTRRIISVSKKKKKKILSNSGEQHSTRKKAASRNFMWETWKSHANE